MIKKKDVIILKEKETLGEVVTLKVLEVSLISKMAKGYTSVPYLL